MPLKFLYDIIVTKITLTKIVLVANAHAGPSNNTRPAFEMTAIALPARYALKPQLLYPYDDRGGEQTASLLLSRALSGEEITIR
jgi:hypothetical protein